MNVPDSFGYSIIYTTSHLIEADVVLSGGFGKSSESFLVSSFFHGLDKSRRLVGATSDGFSSSFAVKSGH